MSTVCLVTGADGFVGSALLKGIAERARAGGILLGRGTVRSQSIRLNAFEYRAVGDINSGTDWRDALTGVSVVVHAAARAHVLNDKLADPLTAFRLVNVAGTMNLASQALQAGVRRFVFISSVGVNGNETVGRPFSAEDFPDPQEPYAISKYEAEIGLRSLLSGTGVQLVIVRPPLVYGPHPPGNFRRLLALAAGPWPLPLGAIRNKRSFVGLDNLVDLLVACCVHPAAADQTFMVSDDEDLSTTELLHRLSRALGKPARLLPVPPWCLRAGAAMLGKRELSQRLCGSLQVDISSTCNLLGWIPPVSVDEGLRRAVAGMFLS